MVIEVPGIKACRKSRGNLAGGDHVGTQPFRPNDRIDSLEAQGLSRIERIGALGQIGAHGVHIGAALLTNAVLVEHIKRRTVGRGQLAGVKARDGQMSLLIG